MRSYVYERRERNRVFTQPLRPALETKGDNRRGLQLIWRELTGIGGYLKSLDGSTDCGG